MSDIVEDWEKRGRHDHLTEEEVEDVRRAYRAGYRAEGIARQLRCSVRTIQKYYGFFRGQGWVRGARKATPECSEEKPSKEDMDKARGQRAPYEPRDVPNWGRSGQGVEYFENQNAAFARAMRRAASEDVRG